MAWMPPAHRQLFGSTQSLCIRADHLLREIAAQKARDGSSLMLDLAPVPLAPNQAMPLALLVSEVIALSKVAEIAQAQLILDQDPDGTAHLTYEPLPPRDDGDKVSWQLLQAPSAQRDTEPAQAALQMADHLQIRFQSQPLTVPPGSHP